MASYCSPLTVNRIKRALPNRGRNQTDIVLLRDGRDERNPMVPGPPAQDFPPSSLLHWIDRIKSLGGQSTTN
jgi:hypothetical protein